jgi:heavy metal sensor kinase
MKALSIRVRLTAWYSLILALSLCTFGGFAYLAISSSIHATLDEGLRQQLQGVRDMISENATGGSAALQDELREFANAEGTRGRLRVVGPDGQVIFVSTGLESLGQPASQGHAPLTLQEEIDGKPFRVLRQTIDVAGGRYDVTVASSSEQFDRTLDRFRLLLDFAVPIFLLLAGLGGYWMSRRALTPVDEIIQAARSIGAQDLAKRLAVPRTGDELERLADTLNEMLGRLETAFRRITQFTADASHELRTPLSVLRTSAELTLRKPRSEAEYREALSLILQESEKVSQMIEQLLVLARADSGSDALSLIRTNLTETLQRACQEAGLLAEAKQLTICDRLPDQPVWVRGDASSLERLFLILLDNAVKYTPGGGRIEVHLGTEDGFAVADIRDTGIGIAPDDIPHVFDRFYRADPARSPQSSGTGLGLAIGHWIVEAHHGEIRVQSEPSKGSSFQVRLPLSKD